MTTFFDLGINKQICENLQAINISEPTMVQEKSIPPALEGKDVLVESATGSGKTIAFGSVLVDKLVHAKSGKALVLAPTRELAEQIYVEMKQLMKGMGMKTAVVFGGVGYQKQITEMKRADIIVATPGRMLDHMQSGNADVSDVSLFVLDEADRMLDMGFLPDVKRILSQIPNDRQFLCYSATYSAPIRAVTEKMMVNPVKIKGVAMVDPKNLRQFYYNVHGRDKMSLLVHLLGQYEHESAMVFCNSRRMVDDVVRALDKANIDAVGIHGGLTQQRRKKVLADFDKKKLSVMVCTDVAARGLDISDVTHVYNYDIPDESKQYIHRIGRTARAGKTGEAVNLLAPRDHENFDRIVRFEDVDVEMLDTPKFERLKVEQRDGGRGRRDDSGRGSRGGFGGGRGSPRGNSRGGPRDGSRGGFGGGRDRRDSSDGNRGGFGNRGGSRRYSGNEEAPRPKFGGRPARRNVDGPKERFGGRDRPKRDSDNRDDFKKRGSRGSKTIHKAKNPRGRSSDRRSGPRRVRE